MTLGRSGWITLAIAAAIIFYQIILPPAIGIADNGDFAKIIGKFDLKAPVDDSDDRSFPYIHLRYTLAPANHWDSGFHSSETLLVRAALRLNRILSKDGAFDIRCMGVIHALLFLLAFAFLLPLLRPTEGGLRIMLLVLAVLIFCDVAYATYYNSFYMDAGALVFLLLAIVFLVHAVSVRQHCSASVCNFALLFCLLFVTSKPQHALLGIPLALFFFWRRSSLLPSRSPLYGAVAAVSLAASGLFALAWSTPPGYTSPALFNMIFWGLLPSAQDPRAELASLGLDESFLQYKGMYAYLSGSPMQSDSFAQEFPRKTSYSRLSIFYATHPRRALDMVKIGLEEAARQRPPALGNFDRSAGYLPSFQSSAFSVWSMAKTRYFRARPWSYLLAFAIATAIVTWRMTAGGLALATMGLLALTIGSLADACDVARHLFLFNVIWDIGFFAAICTLAMGTQPLRFSKRHESGDKSD